ncbi:hypothetical protein CN311_23445 [Mesorhizobium sanjuanii]|uniref:PAS domain-containing protein n=1 Tax=Mesorhizobium sanjuanii TaxID=2037900 RepID=A0A2A6FAC4_9HYPH|nr:hypothetical protein [Mesorhizobium sanjuanii]PDQ18665.1 hypothetical protein CN311_23445 [Mesorhizobium sanjuanii]
MISHDQCRSAPRRLRRGDLGAALRWVAAKWLDGFGRGADGASGSVELAQFGVLEPYLAEAIVLERGADFMFARWGAALDALCGGDRSGHRLSALPQPSRGQLRRLCVRAAAEQLPQARHATWALDGRIWQCAMLVLPTAGDELSATRLLVALFFAPHPMFAAQPVPRGEMLLSRRSPHARRASAVPPNS